MKLKEWIFLIINSTKDVYEIAMQCDYSDALLGVADSTCCAYFLITLIPTQCILKAKKIQLMKFRTFFILIL